MNVSNTSNFEITDDFIINLFFNENEKLNINYVKQAWLNSHTQIKNYLEHRFLDSESIKETLYRILCKIEKRPVCKTCGNKVKFESSHRWNRNRNGWPFIIHCSSKCQRLDKDVTEKRNITNFKKYGCTNPASSKIIQDKIKNTNLNKYGVENVFGNKSIQEKLLKTRLEKYGVTSLLSNLDKVQIDKLSQEQCNNINKIKDKIKTTNLEKYGAESYAQSKSFKLLYSINKNEYMSKQYETKKKNKSFNISKTEENLFNIIKKKYPNVERQYKSNEYPYACDFYIKELNMYIEYNGSWTHGKHPFNINDIDDNAILVKYKNKAIASKYYKNAIYTWTELDVKKLNTAKQNNIKMLIVYNKFDINEIHDVIYKFSKTPDKLLIAGVI